MKKEKQIQKKLEKEKKEMNTAPISSSDEIAKLIKLVVIIAILFGVFYLITYLITKDKAEGIPKPTPNVTEIQYDEILFGEILNQTPSEYYVLIKKEKDGYEDLYASYLKAYNEKENALKVYTAIMDNVFNKQYMAEESNLFVTSMDQIRVKDATLLKINANQIVAVYEGETAISSEFTNLIG